MSYIVYGADPTYHSKGHHSYVHHPGASPLLIYLSLQRPPDAHPTPTLRRPPRRHHRPPTQWTQRTQSRTVALRRVRAARRTLAAPKFLRARERGHVRHQRVPTGLLRTTRTKRASPHLRPCRDRVAQARGTPFPPSHTATGRDRDVGRRMFAETLLRAS